MEWLSSLTIMQTQCQPLMACLPILFVWEQNKFLYCLRHCHFWFSVIDGWTWLTPKAKLIMVSNVTICYVTFITVIVPYLRFSSKPNIWKTWRVAEDATVKCIKVAWGGLFYYLYHGSQSFALRIPLYSSNFLWAPKNFYLVGYLSVFTVLEIKTKIFF